MITGLWGRIVEPFRWGAIGFVALVPVGVLLFWAGVAGRVEEGSIRFLLAMYLYRAGFVILFSGGALASLLPLALTWPGSSPEPSRLARLAGTAALLPVLVVPATAGLAIHDLEVHEEIPSQAMQGHEAVVTVWIEIEPYEHVASASDAWNVTVPLPVADANASAQTTQLVAELREELRRDANPDHVGSPTGAHRTLALEGTGPVTLAGDAPTSKDALFALARHLRLAGGNATAEEPGNLEIRVHGSLCWEPVHDRAFQRVLSVRGESNVTVASGPVPFERIASDACAFVEA